MKLHIITLVLLVGSGLCIGQQINRAEYFIGEDPGFGLAIPIPISSSEGDLSLDFTADIHTLSEGFHFISIRARDSLGRWGLPVQRMFYVFKPHTNADKQITGIEYFIDLDPGFGLATPVPVSSPGNIVTLDFTASIESLSQGFHFLSIRARDSLGRWGFPVQRMFYVFKPHTNADKQITGIEYFIDLDPGFGLATPVPVSSPGNILTLDFADDIESLSQGFHFISIRARDSLGRWSHSSLRMFYVFKFQSAADREISGIEYFIDTDPGFGEASPVEVPSRGNDITINFDVNISSLSEGDHILYIRSKDALSRWGQMYSQGFSFTITDVGEIEIKSLFKLYPNPGNGDFYIDFSEEQNGQVLLTIEDLNGKRVHMEELYNRVNFLHLNLPSGLYLVNLRFKDKNFQQKILINRIIP